MGSTNMTTSSSSGDDYLSGSAPEQISHFKPEFNSDRNRVNDTKLKQKQKTPKSRQSPSGNGGPFDMLAWYPKYQSCQRYFVDHSQHDVLVQAFAAFINILLPYQREQPLYSTRGARSAIERQHENEIKHEPRHQADCTVFSASLIPYIRRLVATGMDADQILHGFFGNDWQIGVGPQRETERRNFLLAAKSSGWAAVKQQYDIPPLETVPFLRPLTNLHEEELAAAESSWAEWHSMKSMTRDHETT